MRLINADALKENMMIAFDCENATKYGNKDAEQQAHSYSTLMLYEISNIVEDCIDDAPSVDFEALGKSLNCQIRASYGGCDDCELSCPRNELIRLLGLKRAKGEWIKKIDDVGFISHICSNCGSEIEVEDPCDDKFCFSCGARMGVKKND